MGARNIIAIIAACGYIIGIFVSLTFWLMMMEEVDRRRPDLNIYSALSEFGSRHDQHFEIFRLYRQLCPDGKLHIYGIASLAVVMASFLTFAILMVRFK